MKALLFLLSLSIFTNHSISQESAILGFWHGQFNTNNIKLDLYLELKSEDGQLKCLLTVPQQMLENINATKVSFKNDTLRVSFGMFGASYRGAYDAESDKIQGDWTQGLDTPLELVRSEGIEPPKRPQEPKPPYDYIVEKVKFRNEKAGITLAGTLTLPGKEEAYPAAILVSGSGPQNRDEELAGHKPFLVIADYLTRNGIAVLRYDDRGVAESEGIFVGATSYDFADDAAAAFDYLKTRSDIDPKAIGIIGHSEGGMIAPVVANNRTDIGFLILLAGPGQPIPDLMTEQNANIFEDYGFTEDQLIANKNYNRELFGMIASDLPKEELYEPVKKLSSEYYNSLPDQYRPLFGPSPEAYYISLASQLFSPWFRSFMAHDAEKFLVNVQCPVLALNGAEDIQVPAKSNLEAIALALEKAGNKDFETVSFEGMNHLFQSCNSCTLAEYAELEETFSEKALSVIANWLNERFK